MEKVNLPAGLVRLTLGEVFKQSMEKVSLPDSLEQLALGNGDDRTLAKIYPASSTSATFKQLLQEAIPKSEAAIESSSSLRQFLLGAIADPPHGYVFGHGAILHSPSGIEVSIPPIQVGQPDTGDIIVFHYADFKAFQLIVGNKRWKHLRASRGDECAHYGDGIYGTSKAPHEFGSKYAVVVNNYTNSSDLEKQRAASQRWLDMGRADICIPIKVSPSIAYNVLERAAPEVPRAGFKHDGTAIRSDRDIWIIRTSNSTGYAQDVGEHEDMTYQRLKSHDFSTRVDALETLAEKAVDSSTKAQKATLQSLRDDDPVVRWHAVDVVAKLAITGHLDIEEARQEITKLMQHEHDLRVQLCGADALSEFVALLAPDV
eukprot:TRINITY_DN15333_c0_g1_i8.p1 TRINITY_DN15333_c0_g1~~TRINITY_DN15333_c0_g1_i8.p1  ORF type:complete len:414 (-),score=86.12 TRINITY_DN15333_c0_g1_i8:42-1160(-)